MDIQTYIKVIVYLKTDDIYKGIAEDVETRFGTSNYELGRKITTKFCRLRAKTYSYLIVLKTIIKNS